MKPEDIDWSEAPEGTTHFDIKFDPDGNDTSWMLRARDGRWFYYTTEKGWIFYPAGKSEIESDFIPRPKPPEKCTVTATKLRELAINSGLQVEFHSEGDIYVWDDVMEVGARLETIDEYIELAEAKIEYQKVWCKYHWE